LATVSCLSSAPTKSQYRPHVRRLLAVTLAPVGKEKGSNLPAHPKGVGFERFLDPIGPRCGALAEVVTVDQV